LCDPVIDGVIRWNVQGSGRALVDILSLRVPGVPVEDHVNFNLR